MELSSGFHGRGDPHMLSSSSGGKAMGKVIEATHEPAGYEICMKPVLDIVEDIFQRATPTAQGALKQVDDDASDERALIYTSLDDQLMDILSITINRISREITYRLSTGEDAHSTTLAVAQIVKGYSWDAKVVLALAAFAMTYGEFLLVVQLYATNPLAKGVALLKQLPEILARADLLKPKFDTLANLINAMVVVAKCIVELKELPSKYISPHDPELSSANADIPSAVYWTIRSIVVCSSQIMSLFNMGHESISSTSDAWELSSLEHNINSIYNDLVEKLKSCRQHINERKDIEAFETLVRLFDATHIDNMKILRALVYPKDGQPPLWDGTTKQRVSIEFLRRKNVLLLISDLEIPEKELLILEHMYNESRVQPRGDSQYEVIWIPVVDRSSPFDDTKRKKFESLQETMLWYTACHPSAIQPAVLRYIKEVWGFNKKPLLVVLDPQGKVVNHNAMHMMFIWGSSAYPFTKLREEALWREETWRIELLADSIDPSLINWINERKFICLYGGEDMNWIHNFTATARTVAKAANIELEMLYMGKSNPGEKVRRNTTIIENENLSHILPDVSLIWFFWMRLESMCHSRSQHGVTVKNDQIMQEILTMLGFDGSDQGWAVISRGADEMARAKGETVLKSLQEYKAWEVAAAEKGFIAAMNDHLQSLRTEHHCNRLVLPGTSAAAIGSINERVVCVECGKPMEMFLMFRCCTD